MILKYRDTGRNIVNQNVIWSYLDHVEALTVYGRKEIDKNLAIIHCKRYDEDVILELAEDAIVVVLTDDGQDIDSFTNFEAQI